MSLVYRQLLLLSDFNHCRSREPVTHGVIRRSLPMKLRFGQSIEAIPITVSGAETPTVLRSESKLAAHAAHVGVERTGSDHRTTTPHTFGDLVARKQFPDVAQKQLREVEILRRQVQ